MRRSCSLLVPAAAREEYAAGRRLLAPPDDGGATSSRKVGGEMERFLSRSAFNVESTSVSVESRSPPLASSRRCNSTIRLSIKSKRFKATSKPPAPHETSPIRVG